MTSPVAQFTERLLSFYEDERARRSTEDDPITRARNYRQRLFAAGLAGLSIPTDLGGQGLSANEAAAITAACSRHQPPEESIFGIGLSMAVPTILEYGSNELQQRVVPPSLSGDAIWCQLYSEPGAGSDLAGLTTRAVHDGDEWIITGQKVWTSGAQHSDLGILIARTNPDAPKHSGITMFVIDMRQPAVTVRPLVQMTGVAEFNEVFLDEARVPHDNIVGTVNEGWPIAVRLLAHERASLGRTFTSSKGLSKAGRQPLPFDRLLHRARSAGLTTDTITRDELASVYIGEKLIGWNASRGLHPSIGKLWRTIQGRAAAQLAHRIGGPFAAAWEHSDAEADYWAYHVLNCRGMSLGGGTDEIQRNTLGERVLDLPREPMPDKNTPFRDLPHN